MDYDNENIVYYKMKPKKFILKLIAAPPSIINKENVLTSHVDVVLVSAMK